jgi:hypothetical protein
MSKYYDIHNHLFNKHFLAKELLYRMIREMKKLLEVQKDRSLDRSSDRGLKKVITTLKRYKKAIRVFTRKNSIAIYEELDKTYKGEFILTPLTFDLTYCFAPSADRDSNARTSDEVAREAFESEMKEMFSTIEQQTRTLSRSYNNTASDSDDQLYREYLEEKEQFMKEAELFQQLEEEPEPEPGTRSRATRAPKALDGWKEQLRQIEELKAHPVYKDLVFPFLAVDPRRPGIAGYARANMGKGYFLDPTTHCFFFLKTISMRTYASSGNGLASTLILLPARIQRSF